MNDKLKKRRVANDPLVAEEKVPAYEIIEEKIRQINDTIIIARIFYLFDTLAYRFQLIKKDKMCMVEIPKRLLDDLKNNGSASEEELMNILKLYIQQPDCWTEVER